MGVESVSPATLRKSCDAKSEVYEDVQQLITKDSLEPLADHTLGNMISTAEPPASHRRPQTYQEFTDGPYELLTNQLSAHDAWATYRIETPAASIIAALGKVTDARL